MNRYRATVYVLTSLALEHEGEAGIRRTVIEEGAESADAFKAQVQDRWLHDVDADVSFGPVTRKDASYVRWPDVQPRQLGV